MDAHINIYTKDTCPYCHAALTLLKGKGARFKRIEVSKDPKNARK